MQIENTYLKRYANTFLLITALLFISSCTIKYVKFNPDLSPLPGDQIAILAILDRGILTTTIRDSKQRIWEGSRENIVELLPDHYIINASYFNKGSSFFRFKDISIDIKAGRTYILATKIVSYIDKSDELFMTIKDITDEQSEQKRTIDEYVKKHW